MKRISLFGLIVIAASAPLLGDTINITGGSLTAILAGWTFNLTGPNGFSMTGFSYSRPPISLRIAALARPAAIGPPTRT